MNWLLKCNSSKYAFSAMHFTHSHMHTKDTPIFILCSFTCEREMDARISHSTPVWKKRSNNSNNNNALFLSSKHDDSHQHSSFFFFLSAIGVWEVDWTKFDWDESKCTFLTMHWPLHSALQHNSFSLFNTSSPSCFNLYEHILSIRMHTLDSRFGSTLGWTVYRLAHRHCVQQHCAALALHAQCVLTQVQSYQQQYKERHL